MAKTILIVDDEPSIHELIASALEEDGYELLHANDGEGGLAILSRAEVDLLLADLDLPGMNGLQMLAQARALRSNVRAIAMPTPDSPFAAVAALRYQVCDLLYKPPAVAELRIVVRAAIASHHTCAPVEVLSAKPEWIELDVPCDLGTVQPLHRVFTQLEPDLSPEVREAIGVAFRELLQNAIEHGGKCDPTKHVLVSYVRLKQMILCRIKDPGDGFEAGELAHAAVSNPNDAPYHHLAVRDQRGLRPGGFGILLAHQLVDEIVYNDCCNEVLMAKFF